MHRRIFVLALVATACAPTKPKEEESSPDRPVLHGGPARPLLAIATWDAPVAGWAQWLAVYEDGLLELRSFEPTPTDDNPFGQELRVYVGRVPATELVTLKAALADSEFEKAGSAYHEDGVHDGGSVIIADMATHRRRVTVINSPPNLPKSVAEAQAILEGLVKTAKYRGGDGFAPGPDRIELIAMLERGGENLELTVFENGLLELRTTYTSSATAREGADYPTPQAITGQAGPGDLDSLRATVSALPSRPPKISRAAQTHDTLFVGAATREFHVPLEASPEMIAVVSAIDALVDSLQSS